MPDPTQTYKSHVRFFPPYHFVAAPILLLNFLNAGRHLYYRPARDTAFELLLAFGLVALAFASRTMALRVQDRVIRLEMQLRLMRVLPATMHPLIASLTPQHFIALRFASDAELADLVRDISEGRLKTQKDIKLRVKNWQPDWLRA